MGRICVQGLPSGTRGWDSCARFSFENSWVDLLCLVFLLEFVGVNCVLGLSSGIRGMNFVLGIFSGARGWDFRAGFFFAN